VRFAVGPIPEPPPPIEDAATESDPPVAVSPEIESEAAAAASEIDDLELRELVARAARASLVKARSDREF
jgi:hypothetical protein